MLEITTVNDGVGPSGQSILVQQTALKLEDWRKDSGYPLCLLRNTVFVIVSIVMLIGTDHDREKPNVQLRVWICGYSLQCVVHLVLVLLEYKRWNTREAISERFSNSRSNWRIVRTESYGNCGITLGSDIIRLMVGIHGYSCFVVHVGMVWLEYKSRNRIISISESFPAGDGANIRISTPIRPCRRWKKMNTMTSEMWWVTGSIWLVFGSEGLLHVAPRLFWFTLAFLAIDVFFAAIRFLLSVFLRFAVRFCFPCIVGCIYFIPFQKGASEVSNSEVQPDGTAGRRIPIRRIGPDYSVESVLQTEDTVEVSNRFQTSIIPQYRFEVSNGEVQIDGTAGRLVPIGTNGPDYSVERVLQTEDTVCCICLYQYEYGEQLHLLPCNHHFHSKCILKWLSVKSTLQYSS